ncbi:MAG: glycosyltransferase family 2 protein [Candidatus Tectomicrobia bacterium]|uniref:Glycosyltransferase family 2 protein n=1 Tax=Tectimicrobiota bacterium TaxID=2528274 RepID=A0A932CLF0_UNCTE|nr:glycosyltransferase family 2 protein [Candidatus Tectomicrobia bacterium]
MYLGKSVAAIIPAYNEEQLIGRVLETMPEIVDRIIVVDDASRDSTSEVVRSYKEKARLNGNLTLIRHEQNHGVGGAIVTGYKAALQDGIDVSVVLAGDSQMDPADLPQVIEPVARDQAEYSKGNRLSRGESWKLIPHTRYLGNSVLSLLTKIASGYWHVADSQSGYTAISHRALERLELDLDGIYKRYGMPNDLLIQLNIHNCRVKDVPIQPVYHVGEKSGIRLQKVIPRISWILLKGFFRRLFQKYIIQDFHPLIFFYLFGFLFLLGGASIGLFTLAADQFGLLDIGYGWMILGAILIISGIQCILFAMWFDMDHNKDLKG